MLPILLMYNKSEIHLFINQYHSLSFDIFFKYITDLGDGLFSIAIAIIFLFVRYRYSIIIFSSYAISGFLVQLLKKTIFADVSRPSRYFNGIAEIHLVEGVKMLGKYSFPSGHSASAFALFFCLSMFNKNSYLKLVFFILALIVAFSRVYLSQHFLIDIVVGSIFGVGISWLIYWYISKSNKKWMDQSIMQSIRR